MNTVRILPDGRVELIITMKQAQELTAWVGATNVTSLGAPELSKLYPYLDSAGIEADELTHRLGSALHELCFQFIHSDRRARE